jgi:hypothetical protein
MRSISFAVTLVVALGATAAWGQSGLYGSPEPVRLPPVTSAYPSGGQAIPAVLPVSSLASVPNVGPQAYQVAYPRPLTTASPTPATGTGQPYFPGQPVTPLPAPSPAQPQGAVVDQMLQESSPPGGYPCTGGRACGGVPGSCGGVGGSCGCYEPCCSPWFVSVNALFMGRANSANRVWTSYESTNLDNQMMNTDMPLEWRAGGEIRFGRRFCCNTWGIEAVYWTLDNFRGFSCVGSPNGVSSVQDTSFLQFNPPNGEMLSAIFSSSEEQKLWRRDEIHNVEVNLIRYALPRNSCCSPWEFDWTLGFRFFRFEELLSFGALRGGCVWDGNGGRDQAYWEDEVRNNLWGAQIGFDGAYHFSRCFSAFLGTKFGLYNNHMESEFSIFRGDGLVVSSQRGNGTYPVCATRDAVSFLTEINLGLSYNFTKCWSAQIGYRVVAATGIALADHQIPSFLVDIPELGYIKNNGTLVLHGAFVGVSYNF